MENSNHNLKPDAKLQVSFPKSSEDHRLQLVEINGSIFAIVHAPLESNGPIRLECEDWSLVLLAPIKSKTDIHISGINVICFNEISSEEGIINIQASNRLIKFAPTTKSSLKVVEKGFCGESRFYDDPGAFMLYYRLFNAVLSNVGMDAPDSFFEARDKFIMSLCALADKIEGKIGNLNIHKVLKFWDITNTCS